MKALFSGRLAFAGLGYGITFVMCHALMKNTTYLGILFHKQFQDDDCVVILSSDDENPQEESDAGDEEADFDEEAVDEEIESEADEVS